MSYCEKCWNDAREQREAVEDNLCDEHLRLVPIPIISDLRNDGLAMLKSLIESAKQSSPIVLRREISCKGISATIEFNRSELISCSPTERQQILEWCLGLRD